MPIESKDDPMSRQLRINAKRKKNLLVYIETVLRDVSKDPYVLEIGAMDGILFDDLHEHIKTNNWAGLLVEPLVDEFHKLIENYQPTNTRLQFANVAVTERSGSQTMVRVRQESDTPLHYRGMSSCFTDRNGLVDLHDSCVSCEVASLSLQDLLNQHDVEKIDILQTDTEGSDYIILRQLDFSEYLPALILFESCCLPCSELVELKGLLDGQGYYIVQNGPADCVASLFPPPEGVSEFHTL